MKATGPSRHIGGLSVLILLSSSERKRYRDDILRCISAPVGARVQFRYSKKLVQDAVWAQPAKFEGQPGLVCSVDLKSTQNSGAELNDPCRLVPVRAVVVEQINVHGDMLTVCLCINSLARTASLDEFTMDVDGGDKRRVPRAPGVEGAAEGSGGYFLFSVADEDLGRVQHNNSIADWQKITADLLGQSGYGDEPYFWTVLGLWRDTPSETGSKNRPEFKAWSPDLDVGKSYTLSVHTYHPNTDQQNFKPSRLMFRSEPVVTTNYPHDVLVDSPYDVKEWRFRIASSGTPESREGWFKIGPLKDGSADESPQPEWEIDLPVRVSSSWVSFIFSSILVGLLISAPAVVSIWLQGTPTVRDKLFASTLASVFGVAGGFASRLGFKKPS